MLGTELLGWETAWVRKAGVLLEVVLLSALTALAARVAVPLPGTPVPMTMQVFAVLLAGLLLGGKRGALSQLLYLGAGLAGVPVFASTVGLQALLGPTGGYLLAFPLAALVAGALSRRLGGLPGRVLAALLGVGVIYAGGSLWLARWMGEGGALWHASTLVRVWRQAVAPFVLVDLAKGVLAALVADRGPFAVQRLLRRESNGHGA